MKLLSRPKSLTEALAPIVTLTRLIGLRVFECPRGQPRPVLSLIYLLLLYTVYFFGTIHLDKEYYEYNKLLKLEYFLYKIMSFTTIFFVLLELLLGWWYTKRFEACYKKLYEIDETLRQLGLTVNYDRIYYTVIGVFVIYLTYNLCVGIVVFINMQTHTDLLKTIGSIVVYSYAIFVSTSVVFEFYLFVKCLQMRFDLINQLLLEHSEVLPLKEMKLGHFAIQDCAKILDAEREIICPIRLLYRWCRQRQSRKHISVLEKQNSIKWQIQSHFPSHFQKQSHEELRNRSQKHFSTMTKCQKRRYLLQTIKQIHLELCKLSKALCVIFGVQAASDIGVVTMLLTGSLYNLYARYIIQQDQITQNTLQQSVVTIFLSFFHITKIIFLSRVCKLAADKGNKTIEIIYSIYGCDVTSGVQEEIEQFGIQMLQSPVRFWAYGISLDNQVLSTMLKTVTTYLVIMIQVSYSLESNKAITSHK